MSNETKESDIINFLKSKGHTDYIIILDLNTPSIAFGNFTAVEFAKKN